MIDFIDNYFNWPVLRSTPLVSSLGMVRIHKSNLSQYAVNLSVGAVWSCTTEGAAKTIKPCSTISYGFGVLNFACYKCIQYMLFLF